MRIALDAMGGDFAPENVMEGLRLAFDTYDSLAEILLVGIPEKITPLMKKFGLDSDGRVELVPASQVVEMTDPPTTCLRKKKDSSITIAARLVKEGRADALVSAGHTGAVVSSAMVLNRPLPGIERPAIAQLFPSVKGFFIILDVGANPDCKPLHMAQYAILGEAYSRLMLGVQNPSIGILNVGEEEHKGNELTRGTNELMRRLPINNFKGNVEGKDLFSGNVDVVVCDGFVGNVVLKCCESLAKTMRNILKDSLMKNPVRAAGALLSRKAFRELKELTDHDEYGGAPLLGVNGCCIIAHGSSSPKAIMNALRVAGEMVRNGLNDHIQKKVADIDWQSIVSQD